MTWEIATATTYVGLSFICLALAVLVDKVKLIKTQEKEVSLPLGSVFIILAIVFAMGALSSQSLIINSNIGEINNSTYSTDLESNASSLLVMLTVILWIFVVVTFIRFIDAVVKALYIKKTGIKQPRY
ncbi:hypothetical protein H8D36_01000 [archaeon]|nr:hypothetical protein [archaeon]